MKILITILTFFTANAVAAQVKISGIVLDNKGKGVAGVSISIKNSYDGATTDSTGAYFFKAAEKGAQTIVFSSIGFKEVEQLITIENAPLVI